MKYDFSDIHDYLLQATEEVYEAEREAGEEAVRINRKSTGYRDKTGHLRASNFYKVDDSGLTIGNSAEYASNVESRGANVANEGALLAHRILNKE